MVPKSNAKQLRQIHIAYIDSNLYPFNYLTGLTLVGFLLFFLSNILSHLSLLPDFVWVCWCHQPFDQGKVGKVLCKDFC